MGVCSIVEARLTDCAGLCSILAQRSPRVPVGRSVARSAALAPRPPWWKAKTGSEMTAIKITDSTNVELITANPHLTAGLGKYLPKGLVTQLVAGVDLVTQVGRDVLEVDKGERGLNL